MLSWNFLFRSYVRNKLRCISLLSTMALIFYFIVLEHNPDKPRNINTTFVVEMEADMPESRIVLGALPRIPSDPDPVKAYHEKQTLERLKYLGDVKKNQHDTLYTVLVPEVRFFFGICSRKTILSILIETKHKPFCHILSDNLFHVHCPSLVRVGNVNDGGKFVCSPGQIPKNNCSIYSFGIAGDISFDEDIQTFNRQGCRLYGYDQNPLVSRLRTQYEAVNGKLTILKIEPISVPSMDVYTLGDILESNNDKSAEIFKIDIEGGEHSVLIPFLQEYRVCQLLIEMHWTANSHTQLLQKIATLDYALFSFQPNALSPTKDCSEYSFIHIDCLGQYGASVTKLYLKDVKPAFG